MHCASSPCAPLPVAPTGEDVGRSRVSSATVSNPVGNVVRARSAGQARDRKNFSSLAYRPPMLSAALYDAILSLAERRALRSWRRELLADLDGDVLELGAGTGANLAFYGDRGQRQPPAGGGREPRRGGEHPRALLGRPAGPGTVGGPSGLATRRTATAHRTRGGRRGHPTAHGAAPRVPTVVARSGRRPLTSLGCLLYTSPSPRDGLLSRM